MQDLNVKLLNVRRQRRREKKDIQHKTTCDVS